MPIIGCIADDFTGATDVASMLVSAGMRTLQTIGVPTTSLDDDVEAVVVALKSRTLPADEAVSQSLEALAWLQAQGCEQFYFKYCSTFDSTPAGNIGPVTDALMTSLGTDFTVACPALPANQRTVYNGYLFAGGRAAQRKRHAGPPSHAHDGCQSGARSRRPDAPAGRPDRLRHAQRGG